MQINIYSTNTDGERFKHLFSYIQKLFSNYIRKEKLKTPITFNDIPTHVSVTAFKSDSGRQYMLEAIRNGTELSPYKKPKWRFTFNETKYDTEIYDQIEKLFLHKAYGWLQLTTFAKRKLWDIFGKDSRNIGVPIVAGVICTEDAYWAIYKQVIVLNLNDAVKYIEQWNSNSVYPIETLLICEHLHEMGIGVLEKLF